MGLSVTFVSGPRSSGKSMLIQTMIHQLWQSPPHYLRLVKTGSDKTPPKSCSENPSNKCGVASAQWLEYDPDEVFAILPEALAAIHRRDRFGSVVLEADADPNLRCAYPYDHRIFVMPLPNSVHEVFRATNRAAEELRRVLDDTAAFASEIFGLFDRDIEDSPEPSEDRPDMTKSQMRGFLYSPLGDELATRIQLQQPYHGLVESDVIVVNTRVGERGLETEECLRRVERLLARIRGLSGRKEELFMSPLCDEIDKIDRTLLSALKPMCSGGK